MALPFPDCCLPTDPDEDLDDHVSSALGIVECLRILTTEAAILKMSRTMKALRAALITCEAEGLASSTGMVMTRDGGVLH